MDDIPQGLCRALRVDAPERGFIFQMDDRRTAGRADFRHLIGLGIFRVFCHTNAFRDDIACLPDLNGVADAKAELPDETLVVKGRPGHCCTGQKDRIKAGRRGQHAGTPDRDLDAAENRLLHFGRILERNSPPGEFVG